MLSFSEGSLPVLEKFAYFSFIFLVIFHPGSMHTNRERDLIQHEYSYEQGGRKSHDMRMYDLHSLFCYFGSADVLFLNEKLSNSSKNSSVSIQDLELRSKYQIFQIHDFEILGLLHI